MDIRVLGIADVPMVVAFARQNFYECVKPFLQDISMVQAYYEYVEEHQLTGLMEQGKLYLWGAYEGEMLVGVAGMQAEGHITILHVEKMHQRRKIGTQLLETMHSFASFTLNHKRVTVSAMPAWSWTFFQKHGFRKIGEVNPMAAGFVPMEAKALSTLEYEKKPLKESTVLIVVGIFLALIVFTAAAVGWNLVFGGI